MENSHVSPTRNTYGILRFAEFTRKFHLDVGATCPSLGGLQSLKLLVKSDASPSAVQILVLAFYLEFLEPYSAISH